MPTRRRPRRHALYSTRCAPPFLPCRPFRRGAPIRCRADATAQPNPAIQQPATAKPTHTPKPTPAATPTPRPAPIPKSPPQRFQNGRWLEGKHPYTYQYFAGLPWVSDGISAADEAAVKNPLYIASNTGSDQSLNCCLPRLGYKTDLTQRKSKSSPNFRTSDTITRQRPQRSCPCRFWPP